MSATTTSTATTDIAGQLDDIKSLLSSQQSAMTAEVSERTGRLDRWLTVAGSVMLPTGVIAILLSWVGASRTPYLFEQIPYLISGGLLGVGFVIGGALLFFGSWIAGAGDRASAQHDQLVAALDRLRRDLDARLEGTGLGAATTSASSGDWVRTPTGTIRHQRDCSIVVGRAPTELEVVSADADLSDCKLCSPTT